MTKRRGLGFSRQPRAACAVHPPELAAFGCCFRELPRSAIPSVRAAIVSERRTFFFTGRASEPLHANYYGNYAMF